MRSIKKHYRFILTTRRAVRRTIKEFKLIDMSRYKVKSTLLGQLFKRFQTLLGQLFIRLIFAYFGHTSAKGVFGGWKAVFGAKSGVWGRKAVFGGGKGVFGVYIFFVNKSPWEGQSRSRVSRRVQFDKNNLTPSPI